MSRKYLSGILQAIVLGYGASSTGETIFSLVSAEELAGEGGAVVEETVDKTAEGGSRTESDVKSSDEGAVEIDEDLNDPLLAEDPPLSEAEEMDQKLKTLMSLLKDNKNVDPDTKAKLEGLVEQLKALGLGEDNLLAELGSLDKSKGNEDPTKSLMTACIVMASAYSGLQRPTTFSALKEIEDAKLSKDVKDNDLMKKIATCTEDLTEEELKNFEAQKLLTLPSRIVELAKERDAEAVTRVEKFDPILFDMAKTVTTSLLESLAEPEGKASAQTQLPSALSLALVCAFFAFMGLLGYKFVMIQMELGKPKVKKEKSDKKKNK